MSIGARALVDEQGLNKRPEGHDSHYQHLNQLLERFVRGETTRLSIASAVASVWREMAPFITCFFRCVGQSAADAVGRRNKREITKKEERK